MELFGRSLTRSELRRRVGRLDQVAGVEPLVLDDGPARGVRALRVRTGSGLSFTILPDRGMDIGAAEYGAIPLSWLSPAGWLRTFHSGLLVTCGLQERARRVIRLAPGEVRRYRIEIRVSLPGGRA